jgi:pimeloyl-ACP methyl ester carboxylesterase
MQILGTEIPVMTRGSGKPLLYLHAEDGFDAAATLIGQLAESWQVIAPTHPGFGHAPVTNATTTVDDLAYLYLEMLDAMALGEVCVVGISFGAWIAAEMAVKSTQRMARLVLADSLGIKTGGRESRDIADFFALTDAEFLDRAYFDPAVAKRDLTTLPEAELLAMARDREAIARYGWSPFMHDPKLKQRLGRIRIPTLVLWGEADRIVTPDYGRTYCAAIPGARFELIARAGHFPHVEQPAALARRIGVFSS